MVVGNEDGRRINGPGKTTRNKEDTDLTPSPAPRGKWRMEGQGI